VYDQILKNHVGQGQGFSPIYPLKTPVPRFTMLLLVLTISHREDPRVISDPYGASLLCHLIRDPAVFPSGSYRANIAGKVELWGFARHFLSRMITVPEFSFDNLERISVRMVVRPMGKNWIEFHSTSTAQKTIYQNWILRVKATDSQEVLITYEVKGREELLLRVVGSH